MSAGTQERGLASFAPASQAGRREPSVTAGRRSPASPSPSPSPKVEVEVEVVLARLCDGKGKGPFLYPLRHHLPPSVTQSLASPKVVEGGDCWSIFKFRVIR